MTQPTRRQDPGLRPNHRHATRRGVAAAAALLLTATGVSAAVGATKVTVTNPDKLVAVGPVNSEHGYPAWYEDSNRLRTELCLDHENPLCGFAPEDVPDPTQPIDFPENFPGESFYMLSSSEVELGGEGQAVLVMALEAAFANDEPQADDQVVFGRQRITVKDGPANTTLTFKHPYGTMTVDTDEEGDGRLVEDISPAIGNFTTALKSNIAPFLRWDPAVAPAAPEGYLGDPAVEHAIIGSPLGHNKFTASNAAGAVIGETTQFSLMGKISTNRGVKADSAILNGNVIDVFATSEGTQLQVDGQEGKFATTPLATDPDSNRFYARIAFTGDAPTSVKISNIGDKPVSSSTINVTKPSGVTILDASYNGTTSMLSVQARSATGAALNVTGFGAMTGEATAPSIYSGEFTDVTAPPANITVTAAGGGSASIPVVIVTGPASDEGLPPTPPQEDPGPVIITDPEPDPTDPTDPVEPTDPVDPVDPVDPTDPAPVAVATAASPTVVPGATTTLDGSGSTGAASFKWSQIAGTEVALSSNTIATPTVTMPYFARTTDRTPVAPITNPVFELVVTDKNGVPSTPATVELAIQRDTVTVGTGSRHRTGKELRITGTSTLTGSTGTLTPATSVVIYNMTSGTPVWLGNAQVTTTGAWEFRAKPGPSVRVTSVWVQSTRGGEVKAAPVAAG